MVATAARTILETLDRIPNSDQRTKVGILAVSDAMHFFCLPVCLPLIFLHITKYEADNSLCTQAGESEPSMLVVSDIDDVYLPKPTDLLVNLTEARPAIESVLGRLSDMFKESATTGSALGPAMQTAHKLIVSVLPTSG
jgi:protein transport protein SEC24